MFLAPDAPKDHIFWIPERRSAFFAGFRDFWPQSAQKSNFRLFSPYTVWAEKRPNFLERRSQPNSLVPGRPWIGGAPLAKSEQFL